MHVLRSCLTLTLALLVPSRPAHAQPPGSPADRAVELAREGGLLHGAVLVARDGEVLHRSASGVADPDTGSAVRPDTPFPIASLTKLLTQALAARLVHLGRLDLDAPVGEYLDGLAPELAEGVRVRHLIESTSGLPRELDDDPRASGVELDERGSVLPFLATLVELTPGFEPGTRESYSNVGYWVLGGVLEAAAGKPYDQALREHVCDPLGMGSTGLFPRSDTTPARGLVRAGGELAPAPPVETARRFSSGGLLSTVDDLHALGRALSDEAFFGTEGVRLLLGDDRRALAAGHLPGFMHVLRVDADTGRFAVVLNNAEVEAPQALIELVGELVGLAEARRAVMEVRSAAGGLPDTALGRAGTVLGEALASGERAAVAAWLSEHTTMDPAPRDVDNLLQMRAELEGFAWVGYLERGEGELFLVARGANDREARVSLIAGAAGDRVEDVRIEMTRRGR